MTRPLPQHIPLQGGEKGVRIEFDKTNSAWMLWLSHNDDWTCGTFLRMYSDGRVDRVTWLADGTEEVFEMEKQDDR